MPCTKIAQSPAVSRAILLAAVPLLFACGAPSDDEPALAHARNEIMLDEPTRWTFGEIPVCVSGGTSSLRAEARKALRNTWFQVADLDITFPAACPTSGQWVRIDLVAVANIPDMGGGTGGFPSPVGIGAGYCDPALGGNCTSFAGFPVDPLEHFRAIIIHEFGHALGFWHEHQRSDRPSDLGTWCPAPNDTDPLNNAIQNGTWLTPEYDAHSIMNYCRDQNDDHVVDAIGEFPNDRLSIGDMVGVANGYGYRFPAFMNVVL